MTTANPSYRTADISKAGFLLCRGCRFIGAEQFLNRIYFQFDNPQLCRKHLFELEDNPSIGALDILRAIETVKTSLRTAREAANG